MRWGCRWGKIRGSTGTQSTGRSWRWGTWWLRARRGGNCRALPVRHYDSRPSYRCLWIIIERLGDTRGGVWVMVSGSFKLGWNSPFEKFILCRVLREPANVNPVELCSRRLAVKMVGRVGRGGTRYG